MSNLLETEILMKFVAIMFSHCIQCSDLLHFHLVTRTLAQIFLMKYNFTTSSHDRVLSIQIVLVSITH